MKNGVHDTGRGDPYRIAYLVAGYIRNTLQDDERDELDEWITASDENLQLFAELTDEEHMQGVLGKIDGVDTAPELEKLMDRIRKPNKGTVKRFWFYMAAASVVIVSGLVIFLNNNNRGNRASQALNTVVSVDLPPGGNRATLTLDNGSIINLDTMSTSIMAAGIVLENDHTAGELVYKENDQGDKAVSYHTLSTPRGGQYTVTLPDGSKVWLNAASTLRYPSAFNGPERKVELTGEGFFEIAKNNSQPFVVNLPGNGSIEVTGTQFNVLAYADEPGQFITLVEGSVKVENNNNQLKLRPRQQAILKQGQMQLNPSPDIEETIAWKNNQFKFNDAGIEEIMAQVKRWYNAEIIYKENIPDHFNATISRDVPVSKLLRYLELTKQIKFKIEGNKIIVMK